MKIEVTKIQARLNSAIPLDEYNELENLSLQMKIQSKLAQPENKKLKKELGQKEAQEKTIERLRAGVKNPTLIGELFH